MDDFLTFALVSLLVEAPYLQRKEADEHSKSGQQRKGTLTRLSCGKVTCVRGQGLVSANGSTS